MAFYSEFAGHYEKVFPFRLPVRDFLSCWLPAQGPLLDIGCGTGDYCVALSQDGRSCLGIDLDPEMIKWAQIRHPQGNFETLGMEDVATLSAKSFAGIYCIGNVLPHLSAHQLKSFLGEIKRKLQPGGVWIFQTVNFDFLQGQPEFAFPVREMPDDELQFHRRYQEQGDGRLLFQTRLVHAGQDVFEGEVSLHPCLSSDLLTLHREVGFELRGHFADYSEKPFRGAVNSGSIFVFSLPEEN